MFDYRLIVIAWVVISLIGAALTGRRLLNRGGILVVRKLLLFTALHYVASVAIFSLTAFLMGESLSMKTVVVVFIAATTLSLVVLAVQEPFSKPSVTDNDENM